MTTEPLKDPEVPPTQPAPQVVVAGAGPAGLTLAGELSLAGVRVLVAERRPSQLVVGSRAGGLHARTIEMLDQRGIAQPFLDEGQTAQASGFAMIRLDMSDFPSRHPYSLGLWQNRMEKILARCVAGFGVSVSYGTEVNGFTQDRDGVEVELSDGRTVRAEYLVGCDGGRSLVRRQAGIDFPGWEATTSSLIAEAEVTEQLPRGHIHDETGIHALHRMEDGRTIRMILTEPQLGPATEPTLEDLRQRLVAVFGSDFGVHSPVWIARFTDATRQAASYRQGRILLAGDAAHIHYPAGGQGITLGIQDAMNLGWKLAQVVRGISPVTLLDTYQEERAPVTAAILRDTMAQSVLLRPQPRNDALRSVLAELLAMEEPRKRLCARYSGLGLHYDLGPGHPLLGRRVPDLDLTEVRVEGRASELGRVFELLHDARPVLLNLGPPVAGDLAPWSERVKTVEAAYDGLWELPEIGMVEPPSALLIRPDGYVAWVGQGSETGLLQALSTWFGTPRL